MKFSEIENNELTESMWWVQRWVSGSINDQDWDTSWLTKIKDVKTAFQIVHKFVGNKYSINKILWRYIKLSKIEADKLISSKILNPHNNHHSPFQSFTTNKSVALNLPGELYIQNGDTDVLISAKIPENLIMFGMKDLLMSKNNIVKEYIASLDLWYEQDEVIVYLKNPIQIISAEII